MMVTFGPMAVLLPTYIAQMRQHESPGTYVYMVADRNTFVAEMGTHRKENQILPARGKQGPHHQASQRFVGVDRFAADFSGYCC